VRQFITTGRRPGQSQDRSGVVHHVRRLHGAANQIRTCRTRLAALRPAANLVRPPARLHDVTMARCL
jgi:hypothetical protein